MADENITVQPDIEVSSSEVKYLKLQDGNLHELHDIKARENISNIVNALTTNDIIRTEQIDIENDYYAIHFNFKNLTIQ